MRKIVHIIGDCRDVDVSQGFLNTEGKTNEVRKHPQRQKAGGEWPMNQDLRIHEVD